MIYKGADLKWIIPHIYLLSDPGSIIYVISPWIDTEISFSITWCPEPTNFNLSEIASKFNKRNIRTVFIFSKDEENNPINAKSIETIRKQNFEFHFVKRLHAKSIVGQRLMYIGSANLTYSGMNRNAEAVTIEKVDSQEDSIRELIGGYELWQILKAK